jgi:multiple sugar transport system substrate-binding protein
MGELIMRNKITDGQCAPLHVRAFALLIVIVIMTGCNNSDYTESPLQDDSLKTPVVTSSKNGHNETFSNETPAHSWTPPPIPVDTIQVDETQTGELVIVMPPWGGVWLDPVISRYKEIYPNVNLIIENDGNNQNPYAYGVRISAELAAGKGPDIIFPSHMFEADNYKMANAGAFLDLNELIEQDTGWSLDDYVKGVLDGGIYKGKRYVIPTGYSVNVFVTLSSNLSGIGFDVSKRDNPVLFMNEVMRTLPNARTNPIFQSMVGGSMWYSLYSALGIQLADYETNTVLPDEETLEKLLKAYQPYRLFDHIIDEAQISHLLNGIVMFAVESRVPSFLSLVSQLKTEGEFQMFVMPDMNGKIHATGGNLVAVRSGSQNKQNAWNFIKLLLSPEIQSNSINNNIPVHKDSIAVCVDRLRNSFDGTSGNMIFTKLSDEETLTFINLITSIDYCTAYFSLPTDYMLHEHMTPYFEGKVSYETAINGLRNQLRLYVSE